MTSRRHLVATLFGLLVIASSVACNVGPETDLSNDMTISGVRDPSVKPLAPAAGIRDPSIKPVARGGIPDDSIKPLPNQKPLNARGGIADDGVKPKKP